MTIVIVNTGEQRILDVMLGKVAYQPLVCKLYTNSALALTDSTVTANLTELSGFGYSPIVLNPATWAITQGDPTNAIYNAANFSFTSGTFTVYGYYIVTQTDNTLVWVEPITPTTITGAQTLRIIIQMQARDIQEV